MPLMLVVIHVKTHNIHTAKFPCLPLVLVVIHMKTHNIHTSHNLRLMLTLLVYKGMYVWLATMLS